MNIFVTNLNPIQCAREHCKTHLNKMIIEHCQLMSTAHHVLDGTGPADFYDNIYKSTHVNHPSAVWVRESHSNYLWLYEVTGELVRLYKQRTGKVHGSNLCFEYLELAPVNIPVLRTMTPFRLAMPDEYKHDDPCIAYRRYLNAKFKEWEQRDRPIFATWDFLKPDWVTSI